LLLARGLSRLYNPASILEDGFKAAIAVVTAWLRLAIAKRRHLFMDAQRCRPRRSGIGHGNAAAALAAGLLAVTVLGIPLAVLLLAWYAVVLYVSRVFTIALLGRFVFDWLGVPDRDRWAFVFGLCLYFFLTAVPFLGPFATLLAVLFGLGAVLLTKKDAYAEVRAQRLI
jgi:hypothetical protein